MCTLLHNRIKRSIRAYITTYFATLEMPKSIESLDSMISLKSIRQMSRVTYVFSKITKEKVNLTEEGTKCKRFSLTLNRLEELTLQNCNKTLSSMIHF
jgi:phage protein U